MIDMDALRRDLQGEELAAFFGGGFGGALMEAIDIGKASDEQLLRIAKRQGIDLRKYEV